MAMEFVEDQNGFALARTGHVTVVRPTASALTSIMDINRLHGGLSAIVGKGSPRLVMDLSEISSAGSAFLGMLLSLAKQVAAEGGRMAMAASPTVQQLLKISKTERLFQLAPSLEAAVWLMEQK